MPNKSFNKRSIEYSRADQLKLLTPLKSEKWLRKMTTLRILLLQIKIKNDYLKNWGFLIKIILFYAVLSAILNLDHSDIW